VLTIAIPWPRSKPFQNQAAVNRNPRARFLDLRIATASGTVHPLFVSPNMMPSVTASLTSMNVNAWSRASRGWIARRQNRRKRTPYRAELMV